MSKRIILSNLAARYFRRDGWDLSILTMYLKSGSFAQDFFYMETDSTYYILNVGGEIDVDKLLADFPDIEIVPFRHEEKYLSKKTLLESRNW